MRSLWCQTETSPFSVSADPNRPPTPTTLPYTLGEVGKSWEMCSGVVISLRAWAALCVISDVSGPPSSPPRSPSVTHSRRAGAHRYGRERRKGRTARLLLPLSARPHWHGPRRGEVISPESCLLPSVAKGNFPLSVFYSDAHVLRWEAAHKSAESVCACVRACIVCASTQKGLLNSPIHLILQECMWKCQSEKSFLKKKYFQIKCR